MNKFDLSIIIYGRDKKFLPLSLIDIDNFVSTREIKSEIISIVPGISKETGAKLKSIFRNANFLGFDSNLSVSELSVKGEKVIMIDVSKQFSKEEFSKIFEAREEVAVGANRINNFLFNILSRILFIPESVLRFSGAAGFNGEILKDILPYLEVNDDLGRLAISIAEQRKFAIKMIELNRALNGSRNNLLNLIKAVKICFSKAGLRLISKTAPRTL